MKFSAELFKRVLSLLVILISAINISYSQNNYQENIKLSHPLNYFPENKKEGFRFFALPETLYVYGIRVQFQQDNNSQTTGDGRFDLSNNYPDSVDAPPHDSLYFLYHLEFLKNYYYKVSKGKLIINYKLLGNIRNLSGKMEDYSPRRNENLQRLGNLFFESWESVDSVVDFSNVNPDKSTFIIFHAGVGRDVNISLQGELDLPSIYLGLKTLKSLYGDTTRGYYTKEGGVIISSSCILPEQEYRIVTSSFGDVFLELGLNGIIAGTIGSHLGLPDLFNTGTGITAIGRFGLMDGQSIFSFSGVFPPEPSAWEKQYLGWIDPVELIAGGTFNSRAASIDFNGNSSVFKVYISAKEYFLVENRNRDALKNGQTVYFISNGVLDSLPPFTKDEDGFQNGDVWKLKKCIVDVDEYDWSLPGIKNDTANFQGGILIWHIDENVIDAKISSNTINNDINHRGVDLEEAKGSQDIGVIINTPFGQFIGDGTIVDYWFSGEHYVPATIYRNEFTPTSIPNSKSYSNLNSRVCLRNFGPIDSSISFTYEQCGTIANINGYPRFVGIDTSSNAQPIGFDFNGNNFDEVFVNVKDSLYGFRDNGNPIRVDMPNGFLKDSVSAYIVGYLNFPPQNKYVVGTYGNTLSLLQFTIDSLTTEPVITTINSAYTLSTPVLVITDRLGFDTVIFAGTNSGRIAKFKFNSPGVVLYDSISNKKVVELAQSISVGPPHNYTAIDESYKFLVSSYILKDIYEPNSIPVRITVNNKIEIANNIVPDHLGISNIYTSPTIAYLDNDKTQDIIFSADNGLFAVNRYGVVLDNFPFRVGGVSKISSGASVADIDGDGIYEVIFGTGDGRVYAYNTQGKILDEFPLLTGKEIKSTPALINSSGKFGIVVYSTDGFLYGWKTQWAYDSNKILWRNFLNDKYHCNYAPFSSKQSIGGPCLPQDKVYNWPNPVYGKTTNIRYFLNGTASSVKIKIMDLSGELVTTLTGTANKGFDNEVPWDVSTVQSGIYIGIVELEGGDCNETASFKIAVVK